MTLSGKNPVLTLAVALGGQSMISYGKHTALLASVFPSESVHRWDYLSASVGFPSALSLLWEPEVVSLRIMELPASVQPVSDRFHSRVGALGYSLHSGDSSNILADKTYIHSLKHFIMENLKCRESRENSKGPHLSVPSSTMISSRANIMSAVLHPLSLQLLKQFLDIISLYLVI